MHLKSLLLVTAALAAPAVVASSADAARCGGGNFCLWENANEGGGLYFFSGNDPNLHNDRFNGSTRVGDNGTTAKNNGNGNDPSGLVDVRAYQNTNFRGPALCIPLGTEIKNLMKTYVQYPPRKLQSAAYSGPLTLSSYQKFEWLREQLRKEGFNLQIPTGN